MRIHRYERTIGSEYDIHDLPENILMHLIIGLKAQIEQYTKDRRDPKYGDLESQEYISGEIREMRRFIRETEKYITITKDGFQIH